MQSFFEASSNHNIASSNTFDAQILTKSCCPWPTSNTHKYPESHDGLELLYSPDSCASSKRSISAVDIIAVHGLNGNANKTWTHPNGKLWLKDFLPTALPGARIFTYGYDAKVSALARVLFFPFFPFSSCSRDLIFGSSSFLLKETTNSEICRSRVIQQASFVTMLQSC